MGAADGGRAVVGEAMAAAGKRLVDDRAAAAGEQLSMMPVPGSATSNRAVRLRAGAARSNKAGRPLGAVNKSSKALREYLLARGVHPLQRMMQWMLHTPASLAVELGCTPLEAFEELRKLWGDAAPYFAPKMVPTDDQGREVPFFQMILGGQHVHAAGAPEAAPWLDPATGRPWGAAGAAGAAVRESQQNQALLASAPAVSHAEKSHEGEE